MAVTNEKMIESISYQGVIIHKVHYGTSKSGHTPYEVFVSDHLGRCTPLTKAMDAGFQSGADAQQYVMQLIDILDRFGRLEVYLLDYAQVILKILDDGHDDANKLAQMFLLHYGAIANEIMPDILKRIRAHLLP